jgi:hypothetical protein
MRSRSLIGAIVLAAALLVRLDGALAFDETKYPDWRGQWTRVPVAGLTGQPSFDPSKSDGRRQQAPLTPKYQAILEASLADQAAGGAGNDRDYARFSPGMPRIMNVYTPMEIIIMPDTTYIWIDNIHDSRRIYADGRDWPEEIEPSFAGYSIGKWVDENGDGRYDVLEVETRGFRGPRAFDSTGLPLHKDNQSLITERIYSDKTDRSILHDEITVIDHALTHPWTVTKNYHRTQQARPLWFEGNCSEENQHVRIGNEHYMLSADGRLMPAKKDQEPPDLRYFKKTQK